MTTKPVSYSTDVVIRITNMEDFSTLRIKMPNLDCLNSGLKQVWIEVGSPSETAG